MFGLLHNLYKYARDKSERKITLATLGLDNAGKTTIINTIQGLLDKEVSTTFGFNSHTLTEGKYKIEVYDLGGSKNIRRIWKTYLADVHALIYVVDAADSARFEESRKALDDMMTQAHLHDKPVLIFANKQDLPTAAAAPVVAEALGLTAYRQNRFNIMGCVAKTPVGQQPDGRLRDGLKWVVGQVNSVFGSLDVRVKRDVEAVKAEDERKRAEKAEMVRKQKEERAAKQRAAEAAAQQEERNALASLPNQIDSPHKPPAGAAAAAAAGAAPFAASPLGPGGFSDLQAPDQGHQNGTAAAVGTSAADTNGSYIAPASPVQASVAPAAAVPASLPPLPPAGHQSLAPPPPSIHQSLAAGGSMRRAAAAEASSDGAPESSRAAAPSPVRAESRTLSRPGSGNGRPQSGGAHNPLKLPAALEGAPGEGGLGGRHSNRVTPVIDTPP